MDTTKRIPCCEPKAASGYYVIIRRLKSHKYGEAMLSPVMNDGGCLAAIDHGTVAELAARAEKNGHQLLGTVDEPYDGQGLYAQGQELAKLVEARRDASKRFPA